MATSPEATRPEATSPEATRPDLATWLDVAQDVDVHWLLDHLDSPSLAGAKTRLEVHAMVQQCEHVVALLTQQIAQLEEARHQIYAHIRVILVLLAQVLAAPISQPAPPRVGTLEWQMVFAMQQHSCGPLSPPAIHRLVRQTGRAVNLPAIRAALVRAVWRGSVQRAAYGRYVVNPNAIPVH